MRVTCEYIRKHTSNIRLHTSSIQLHTYIRVAYDYIRVTYDHIQVTYDHIQTHTVIYESYTNALVTYEYLGATYDGMRVIKVKCNIFLFHFCTCAGAHNGHLTCVGHVLHTFMRQVFIALCFVAVLEYVRLQLPTQRIYRLFYNSHFKVMLLFPGFIEPFFGCTMKGYVTEQNQKIWTKIYMDF